MDEPLGLAVGNALEVKEAIATLSGHGPKDLVELCIKAGGIMLTQAHIAKDEQEGEKLIEHAISSGAGLAKLRELVEAQGGDPTYIDDPSKFPVAGKSIEIRSDKEGYVHRIDSLSVGVSAMKLGAGRKTMDDVIDMSAGVVLSKKVGDKVEKGELLCTAYTNIEGFDEAIAELRNAFEIDMKRPAHRPIVHDYIKA